MMSDRNNGRRLRREVVFGSMRPFKRYRSSWLLSVCISKGKEDGEDGGLRSGSILDENCREI